VTFVAQASSNLYLIGDLVVGKNGGSIITAFNSAVHAMKRICTRDFALQLEVDVLDIAAS